MVVVCVCVRGISDSSLPVRLSFIPEAALTVQSVTSLQIGVKNTVVWVMS